jgi:hypothetical protein
MVLVQIFGHSTDLVLFVWYWPSSLPEPYPHTPGTGHVDTSLAKPHRWWGLESGNDLGIESSYLFSLHIWEWTAINPSYSSHSGNSPELGRNPHGQGVSFGFGWWKMRSLCCSQLGSEPKDWMSFIPKRIYFRGNDFEPT